MNPAPGERVVALVVSHDGARWLPSVIGGLQGQRTHPARVVAVDTGSKDGSADLLEAAFGADAVVHAPSSTSFPAAVRLGLEAAGDPEWVWILHDDANPAPDALAALLAAAEADPEADVLGPKLREWPSLRRLLEVGVTISGTGRRETGLERSEYDQGQHDDVRTVLAVNTAGMLVRRSAGAAAVVAVEPRSDRRALARDAGAATSPESDPAAVRDALGGELADQVFVCTSDRRAIADALHLAAPGGVVQLFAPTPPGELVPIDLGSAFFREVTLQSTYSAGPADTRAALALLSTGAVDASRLVSHRLPLSRVEEAFRLARSGEATKVVVEP